MNRTAAHQKLREFLYSEKHQARVDVERMRQALEFAQEHLAEAIQELLQYPYDQDIDEDSHEDLAEKCETAGLVVPDELLIDDTAVAS